MVKWRNNYMTTNFQLKKCINTNYTEQKLHTELKQTLYLGDVITSYFPYNIYFLNIIVMKMCAVVKLRK